MTGKAFLAHNKDQSGFALKVLSHSHPALAGCIAERLKSNRFNGFPERNHENR
jgi:hypothetical protein